MSNIYYIYRHIRLDTNTPFYIGKGSNNRANLKKGRNTYWQNIVNKTEYKVEILKDELTEKEAFKLERKLISLYKTYGYCEANLADGGIGCAGYKHTPEAIEKIRKHFTGKKRSKEDCKKMSKAQLERFKTDSPWNKGIPCSQETKDKLSKSLTGKKRTPEQIEAMKGRTPWNKGQKLPEQSEARKGSGNPMFGKKQSAKYYEGRKKMLGGGNPSARKVIDTKTGIIYDTIKEAAEQFGLNVNTLRGYINGHRPNKTNLKYYRGEI